MSTDKTLAYAVEEALGWREGMRDEQLDNLLEMAMGMLNSAPVLEDAQPGGRVRLGDQAERARFEAWATAQGLDPTVRLMLTSHPPQDGGYADNSLQRLWRAWQAALAAQPSTGGQDALSAMLPDDARLVGVMAENIERGKLDHPGFYRNTQLAEVLRRVLSAALAARQPVEQELWCLHVLGMDDVHPAPSKAHAEKAAAWHNEQFKDHAARLGISIEAKVVPWPHSAESHAAEVAEFIPDWLIPQWQLDALEANAKQPAQAVDSGQTFQACVAGWMGQCFLPSLYSNMTERGDRLLEEVLELLQAHGYDKARVPTLVDYVFGRPVGDPTQEVGGVMVTLAGYCWVAGLDMHAAGDAELARITQPEVMAKIRAKQEAKNALHFDTPLPGSAARQPVGWKPMESAPKDGTVVLGLLEGSDIPQSIRFRDGWEIAWDGYRIPAHDGPLRWAPLYAATTAPQAAQVYLDGLDRALGEAIDLRDRYHEMADDLAGHIAAITGVDIGEHSSANFPWQNAIEAAEEYKPAQAVDQGQIWQQAFNDTAHSYRRNKSRMWVLQMLKERVQALIDSQAAAGEPNTAQAVDLGQFRAQVADLLRSEFDLEVADPEDHRHDDGRGEADRIAGRIAALIDSQAEVSRG